MRNRSILHRTIGDSFFACWAAATLAGAALVTAADGVLLQRSKGYFTGGFLAEDYLTGPGQTAVFVVVSLLADAAVIGLVAWAVLWGCARWGVRAAPATVAACMAAVAPLAIADVLAYELSTYLGDVFDLALAFELADGNPLEMLAVASGHIVMPAMAIVAACGGAGGLVWLTSRLSKGSQIVQGRLRLLGWPALVAGLGLLLSTAAAASSDVLENGLLRKPSGKVLALLVAEATDFDRDGFGLAGRTIDPDPFDAAVFPYALDLPGNGIDENGVAGDLPADARAYHESGISTEPWALRPDVVLVVLESFRADLIGARYEGREITPVLNALAARGVSVRHAYSHNGYTAPSRYHLFAGRLAGPPGAGSLLDDFHANGYTVGYFSGQDESFGADELAVDTSRADVFYDARMDQDRRYSTFTTAGSLAVPFTVVQERIGEFLRETGGTASPLFLYANFHDAHFPYWHDAIATLTSDERLPRSAIDAGAREALWATYVNTASNLDRAVGDLLDAVARVRGRMPAVIVTADHGESLFDEGFLGHGYVLNDVQTRIPLIVDGLPIAIDEPFGQRDLRGAVHTALRTTASEPPVPRVQAGTGREVFQYLGRLHRPRQIAFLQGERRTMYDFRSRRVSIRDGAWRAPDDLSGEERHEFLRLVHYWEQVMLARRGASAAAVAETGTE